MFVHATRFAVDGAVTNGGGVTYILALGMGSRSLLDRYRVQRVHELSDVTR